MKKLNRFNYILAVLVIVSMLLATVGIVFAISNPSGPVEVIRTKVFNNIFETGDWLVVTEYDVPYSVVPAEEPDETYMAALYSGSFPGTPSMVASNPLNYYDHNVISIYLSSSQVVSKSLDFDDVGSYAVRVTGQPGYFTPLIECPVVPGSCNMDTYNLDSNVDVYNNSQVYNRQLLGDLVQKVLAPSLEDDWPVDLLTANDRLNSVGALIFNKAIPGLDQACPWIFETATSIAAVAKKTVTSYIYPDGDYLTGIDLVNPSEVSGHFNKVNFPVANPEKRGVVDSGSTTAVLSSDFEQANDYWVSAKLTVYETTDGGAPQGEFKYVRDFISATDEFVLAGTLSASVQAGDKIELDYGETYVYTTSANQKTDLYDMEEFAFNNSAELEKVVIHATFSSSDDGLVYCRPFIRVGSTDEIGEWRLARYEDNDLKIARVMGNPISSIWSTDIINSDTFSFRAGADVYSGNGVSEVRLKELYVELVYTTPDFTGDYAEGLSENMGNRLQTAFNNLGEWLGVPGTIAAGIGAALLFFILAGRVFVATGSTHAAIALTIPFLLLMVLIGLIPMYLIFIIAFSLILLFGITFILARIT